MTSDPTVRGTIESEVCIVGAGPAGLTVASELVRAGRRVVLLESGGHRSVRSAQHLNDGDVTGAPYLGLRATRHRGVGGTAGIWNTWVRGQPGAKYVPLDPADLAGWPITWDELASWYPAAQAVCGLGPFDYGPGPWLLPGYRPFALDGTGLTNRVYQLGTAAAFLHRLPADLAASGRCTLLTRATVTRLELDHSGRTVTAVRVERPQGPTIRVRSGAVVLASGAIENPRLMLLADLGARHGLRWLGRGFMEHPRDYAMELLPARPDLVAEAGFYGVQSAADGTLGLGRLALTESARERLGLPNASVNLIPRPEASTVAGLRYRLIGAIHRLVGVPWRGREAWSAEPARPGRYDRVNLILHLEQRPSPDNRVELGRRVDRLGNRLPMLHLSWTEREQQELDRMRGLIAGWLQDAGVGRVQWERGRRPDLNAHHHAGTTRMGTHPDTGVVDRNGRVFGMDNLYLAGASVFPTAGFANPVLTIVALGLRLGRHLTAP